MASRIITITTDFGLVDSYVAEMKGVILSINPDARLIDMSHELEPHNVMAAAVFLERACAHFPPGTVHMAVVDPGVGTSRRALCVKTDRNVYIAPDNGLLTLVLEHEKPWRAVELTNTRYHYARRAGSTFHGRDIFAPVAAHISLGLDIDSLGEPADSIVQLDVPRVTEPIPGHIEGSVVSVDRFGNLITNISRDRLPADLSRIIVEIAGVRIHGISVTYGEKEPGDMLVLLGSDNCLEISVNRGNAAARFGTGVGSRVNVRVK